MGSRSLSACRLDEITKSVHRNVCAACLESVKRKLAQKHAPASSTFSAAQDRVHRITSSIGLQWEGRGSYGRPLHCPHPIWAVSWISGMPVSCIKVIFLHIPHLPPVYPVRIPLDNWQKNLVAAAANTHKEQEGWIEDAELSRAEAVTGAKLAERCVNDVSWPACQQVVRLIGRFLESVLDAKNSFLCRLWCPGLIKRSPFVQGVLFPMETTHQQGRKAEMQI